MKLYTFIKNIITSNEPGANNEFQEFEDFVNTWFK